MGEIYLVRHGQASFGAADYDQLSDLGFEQARRLGLWLAETGQRFNLAVTGALRRHHQTAASCLTALGSGCPRIADPGFCQRRNKNPPAGRRKTRPVCGVVELALPL